MEETFETFRGAVRVEDGYALASTIRPVAPPDNPELLRSFFHGSTSSKIQTDVRYAIIYKNDVQLSKAEGNAWLEVFVCYWKAIGELLAAEEPPSQGRGSSASWGKAYEAWREVVNSLIRGYQSGNLGAWTIPCLYTAGKYLRLFAINADEQAEKQKGTVTFNAGFQDDVVGSVGKHEKLEDAARQINRMFSLCISDR